MKKLTTPILLVLVLILGCSALVFAQQDLPKKKQTVLKLYISAQNVYAKWQADPDKIKILDVRTPGEYIFVGHAPMAVNIPLNFFDKTVNPLTMRLVMPLNENFVAQVKSRFKKTDTFYVMCRSGGRSAASVNLLAKAGFKNVYNIIDGFEGDALKVEGSYQYGKRVINGWKNSGAPWTYSLDRKLVYQP
jgi:rhodanese-related sulfurtransferase